MAVNNLIILRKGTASQWNSANPVLASGEPGYDLTNQILKVGDGVTAWNSLSNHTHTASNISDFNTSVSGLVSGIYAPLSSPTFTGTVNGITKSMVGLGNVDNTSDANKPISTATQTALDNKAASSHTHTSSNITDFNSSVSGLLPVSNITPSSYIDIVSSTGNFTISVTGLQPAGSYASSIHSHSISDVTGLQTALDNKQSSGNYAASSHTHTASQITDFSTAASAAVISFAPVNFSGSVDVPTNLTTGASSQLFGYRATIPPWAEGQYVYFADQNSSIVYTGILKLVYAGGFGTAFGLSKITSITGSSSNSTSNSWIMGFASTPDFSNASLLSTGTVSDSLLSSNVVFTTDSRLSDARTPLAHSHVISDVTGLQTVLDAKQASGSYAASSHTHSASNITDFNSAVSGILPVINIVPGSNITVSPVAGTYTISSTASGGGASVTIVNSGVNRVLISDGSTSGISAQANLTFNGSTLTAPSGSFTNRISVGSNNITENDALEMLNATNLYLWSSFR